MTILIQELVNECLHLQDRMESMTPVLMDFNPSWQPDRGLVMMNGTNLHPAGRMHFLEKLKEAGWLERIRNKYASNERALRKKMVLLAEVLEEEEFEVERFKHHLNPDQFSWLHSQKGRIKKFLRGIEL